MTKQTQPFYAFGPFRLDSAQKELRRDGAVVPLAPKVFDTLLALVESAGRIVPKDELMKRVWPDTFVEEGNLSVHIFNLRRVLGQENGDDKYIETVPKRGYRFVGPVRELEGETNDELPEKPIQSISVAANQSSLPEMKLNGGKLLSGWIRQKRATIAVLLILVVLGPLLGWFFHRQAKIGRARGELLPKIEQLVEAGWENYVEAYKLAVEAEKYLPHDPKLAELLSKIAFSISIKTEPPGANIYAKEYRVPESDWKYSGVSPIDKIRLPIGVFRWKMEKEGYETVLAASPTFVLAGTSFVPCDLVRVLDKKGTLPIGMARVKGEKEIGDFFIDQYEVSNQQFKNFVDGSGYQKREYWKQKFIKGGKELTWEEGIKEFVDQTGQPGPVNWRVGDYPEGQADYTSVDEFPELLVPNLVLVYKKVANLFLPFPAPYRWE